MTLRADTITDAIYYAMLPHAFSPLLLPPPLYIRQHYADDLPLLITFVSFRLLIDIH